ncbi:MULTISPECIES: NAD-dependent epimerase/dehydratase family protein [unclassified Mesorhizobium]|uniref:NAD-dependent epimerase/dehydratase family protein n=1 Tax=unclassified Mesorhizobium TaxID=325217 RepID=UPI000BAEAF59|nr:MULTISPECIES: NAD-dependent epimerase/dehydratase family protein [unclassified Mesorhizobium]PBC23025.1 UDP-glucose 4-epimerase [Mesorhizobium sp. WSM4311]TRC97642.1 NAD-dependent epimerase/dehydratase family protein [Mesorhizobium sp. WSM4305]
MPRSVLVSGGCGFLGSHLVDRLLRRDDLETLVVVDNLWTGSRDNIAHVSDPRLSLRIADAETFTTSQHFDEIIHLASPASPVWYMREPARTIKANIGGALNLLSLLRPGGRFCFASTSEVYGDPLMSPQPESYRGSVDCTGPRSSYDESKRCTEALLFEEQRVSGLDVRVVRLFNTYGPRTRIDDGRAVSNFVCQALTTGILTVHGDGSQSRSWGYVDDIVDGLERFFWRDSITYRGPLNIGNNREVSVLGIAKFVCSLVQGSRIEHHAPIPQDPTNRCPDLTLARQVLPGWEATTSYEEGIRRTFEWYRRRIVTRDRSAASA